MGYSSRWGGGGVGIGRAGLLHTLGPYKSEHGHMRNKTAPDIRFWLNLCGACASPPLRDVRSLRGLRELCVPRHVRDLQL